MKINKNTIIERIQNYLYSFYAKDLNTAREREIYDCLCRYIMESVGKTWVSSKKIKEGYEVYILSFEYLPGSFLSNIIYKLKIEDEIRAAIEEIGFDYDSIMAYDLDPALGIGDMGMGSSYLINALTDQKIKATAYALRYESGDFKQVIANGKQEVRSDSWLEHGSNWEHQKSFTNLIEIYGKNHKTVTYDMPILSSDAKFVNTLRLFKSEPTSVIDVNEFSNGDIINAYEDYINNLSITQFLYVDDSSYEGKILRLKQEYFFAASAMRDFVRRYILYYKDINNINKQTNVIINDIHPTLALVEFIRILTREHKFIMRKAIAYTREIFYHLVFSITDDSLEKYPADEIRKLNPELYSTIIDIQTELGKSESFLPLIENGQVIFKNINIVLSREYIFLSKVLFENKSISSNTSYMNMGSDRQMYGQSANPKLYDLLREYNINDYSNDSKKLIYLKEDKDFINKVDEIKYNNKLRLIEYLNDSSINPYSMFDLQLSIIHESKRQILNALEIAYDYFYLRDNTNAYYVPKTYIFSGKANEGYYVAKETIKFILALKKLIEADKIISKKIKIIFVENTGVKDLRILYPAADIYSNLAHPLMDNQNFDILNCLYNMSNVISTKAGIVENLDIANSFYLMDDDYKSYEIIRNERKYIANDIIYQNKIVKYTIERLLSEPKEAFPYDFKNLYDEILLYNDSFNVFLDLENLVNLRKDMQKDYVDKEKWIQNQMQNFIWASKFNLDDLLKRKRSFDK